MTDAEFDEWFARHNAPRPPGPAPVVPFPRARHLPLVGLAAERVLDRVDEGGAMDLALQGETDRLRAELLRAKVDPHDIDVEAHRFACAVLRMIRAMEAVDGEFA